MSFTPLPKYLNNYSKNNNIRNFGLFFQKFFPYDSSNWKTDNSVDEIVNKYSCDNNLIKKKNKQQVDFLNGYKFLSSEILKIRAVLTSRLITGIGEISPTEVGMVFDRNMGIPYIPASSVKGAVRYAYCINYARDNDENDPYINSTNGKTEFNTDEPGFTALFGSPDDKKPSKGGFCFMDAYPANSPVIKCDIMNPHFGKYYQGEQPPVETESPIPIKFLAVEKRLEFNFRGYFIKQRGAEQYKDRLEKAFKTALEETGLGAKTAVGYGMFKLCDEEKVKKASAKQALEPEIWEKAFITYTPNTSIISAKSEGKNATTKNKEIIPENKHKKLFKKKKSVTAKIKAELIGGKEYRLVEVLE